MRYLGVSDADMEKSERETTAALQKKVGEITEALK
jgi:hypothetical protein